MLADITPEIKPEAAVADDTLEKQLKAFQERLQSQTILPPPNPNRNNNTSDTAEEDAVVNFGWNQIENGPILPFIKRESESYVAYHIVAELVYKNIQKEFSNEMLFCMALIMERMSQKEANTFNEININHCDRSIAGNHNFKVNEFMIRLEFVQKIVEYHQACRNLVICKIKENNLFGFIHIGGESRVPFIWNGDQKLVPLFYFEHCAYLDSRQVDLTDPFKIGYLKFCCKVQKIKKDYYEQTPLKVVDFDEVKKLFPIETTFELNLPEKVNQDLLAPEIRIALLHGIEEAIASPPNSPESVTTSPSIDEINNNVSIVSLDKDQVLNDSRMTLKDLVPESSNIDESLVQKENPQGGNNYATKTLATELIAYKEHMHQNEVRRASKRPANTINSIEEKRPKKDVTSMTMIPEEPAQSYTVQSKRGGLLPLLSDVQTTYQSRNPQEGHGHLLKSHLLSRLSKECTVSFVEATEEEQNNSERISELAAATPVAKPSTVVRRTSQDVGLSRTSDNQITNVPYQSPRGASSPGLTQSNQLMIEAALRTPEYPLQSITSSTEITTRSTQQTTIRNTGIYQPAHLHQVHGVSYGIRQAGGGHMPQYYQRRQANSVQQQNSTNASGCFSRANNYQLTPRQSRPVQNRSINASNNFPGTNYYQHASARSTAPAPPSTSPAMQYQNNQNNQAYINSQLQKTNEEWNRFFQQIQHRQVQQSSHPQYIQKPMQQSNYVPHVPGMNIHNQNFQNHPVSNFTGCQANSHPYYQRRHNPSAQNVNISYEQYTLVQNSVQNCPSTYTPTSATSNRIVSSSNQDINNNNNNSTELITKVMEHPECIDSNPEFYATKICFINSKNVLGISKSPIAHSFLVNLSEIVEKVLGLNPFNNHDKILTTFKSLYRLNPVQRLQWDNVSRGKQLQFVGPFKDVFVEYDEISIKYL